jgi:hypothetical protein
MSSMDRLMAMRRLIVLRLYIGGGCVFLISLPFVI